MPRFNAGSIAAVVLFAGWMSPSPARGQSLAEVAGREKDRRARLAGDSEHSPAPVIGEKELSASSGSSFSVTGKKSPDEPAGGASEPEESEAESGSETHLTDKEAAELRETWSRVWSERMEQAQTELDQARDDAYQCEAAGRYVFVPIAVDCDGVELRRARAEARFRQVKRQRYDWQLLLPGPKKAAP